MKQIPSIYKALVEASNSMAEAAGFSHTDNYVASHIACVCSFDIHSKGLIRYIFNCLEGIELAGLRFDVEQTNIEENEHEGKYRILIYSKDPIEESDRRSINLLVSHVFGLL